jgi:hypothetical protein
MTKGKIPLTLTCSKEPTDKKEVDDILAKGKKGDWHCQ